MDYGQNSQYPGNKQPFFTAGVGSVSPTPNSFEAYNNLDSTNPKIEWDQPQNEHTQNEHDYRGIGNLAIFPANSEELVQENVQNTPDAQIEQVIDQGVDVNSMISTSPASLKPNLQIATPYNAANIHADGEHISRATRGEINRVIAEFNQIDNASSFYDAVRGSDTTPGMLQKYLENSFNRKVA